MIVCVRPTQVNGQERTSRGHKGSTDERTIGHRALRNIRVIMKQVKFFRFVDIF